jgi:hypothetical protein
VKPKIDDREFMFSLEDLGIDAEGCRRAADYPDGVSMLGAHLIRPSELTLGGIVPEMHLGIKP